MKFIIESERAVDPKLDSWNFIDFAPVFGAGQRMSAYNAWNKEFPIVSKTTRNAPSLHLPPETRMALPTGIVVEDLPEDHILEVSVISSATMQMGIHCPAPLRVMNGEPIFINVHNISDTLVQITSGAYLGLGRLIHVPKDEVLSVKSYK